MDGKDRNGLKKRFQVSMLEFALILSDSVLFSLGTSPTGEHVNRLYTLTYLAMMAMKGDTKRFMYLEAGS